jgi:hypothetical protein
MIYDTNIIEATADVLDGVVSINMDTPINHDWYDGTDDECVEDGTYVDLYGPSVGTIALTAYPFDNTSDDPHAYTMGFTCPVAINVSMPWEMKWDCRECYRCIDPLTGAEGEIIRGKWIGIPGKKRQVEVTGDISGIPIDLMEFGDCMHVIKRLNIDVNQVFTIPQLTYGHRWFKFHGNPLPVDTDRDWIYEFTVNYGVECAGLTPISVDGYLVSFQFNYTPPQPPTITYNFQFQNPYCPSC